MSRRNLYVASGVGALISYIFNQLAFTGSLDFARLGVFAVIFLAVTFGFEKFIDWAETLES